MRVVLHRSKRGKKKWLQYFCRMTQWKLTLFHIVTMTRQNRHWRKKHQLPVFQVCYVVLRFKTLIKANDSTRTIVNYDSWLKRKKEKRKTKKESFLLFIHGDSFFVKYRRKRAVACISAGYCEKTRLIIKHREMYYHDNRIRPMIFVINRTWHFYRYFRVNKSSIRYEIENVFLYLIQTALFISTQLIIP